MSRSKRTKAEQEYVKAIIQALSLQRLTDQEIADYLHNEKQIEIGRSTVTIIKNNIQKQAEKWYIELRNSAYKYLAQYKERIDSLLSYQRALHDIISSTKKDETKIRAISELHSIEMDILSLWKQLPASNIVNTIEKEEGKKLQWAVQIQEGGEEEEEAVAEEPVINPDVWTIDPELPKAVVPTTTRIPSHTDEAIASNITTEIQETIPIATQEPEPEQKPNDVVDIDIVGRWPKPFDVVPWVQCKFNNSNCNKWFKTKEIRSKHVAKYHS